MAKWCCKKDRDCRYDCVSREIKSKDGSHNIGLLYEFRKSDECSYHKNMKSVYISDSRADWLKREGLSKEDFELILEIYRECDDSLRKSDCNHMYSTLDELSSALYDVFGVYRSAETGFRVGDIINFIYDYSAISKAKLMDMIGGQKNDYH